MSYLDVPDVVPGPGQVLVDVRAAGVCFPDLLLSKGEYQLKVPAPFIPGMEVAGVVAAAPAESGFAVGERVSGSSMLGGYAEQVAVPAAGLRRSPAELDDAEAVSLLVNYHTMYFAFERRAALRPGETVLVLGSAGGVGTAAIQVAKAMGARVVAVVHRTAAMDFVSSLGPDVVLPLSDGWHKAVLEATGGRGVDIVLDPVGGDRVTDSLRCLAPAGRLLVVGFTGGEIPTIKVNRLLLNNVDVVGVGWGAWTMRHPGYLAEQWDELSALLESGTVPPPQPHVFPLEQAAEAIASLENRSAKGKVVVKIRG